jgi:hypothetical protein
MPDQKKGYKTGFLDKTLTWTGSGGSKSQKSLGTIFMCNDNLKFRVEIF